MQEFKKIIQKETNTVSINEKLTTLLKESKTSIAIAENISNGHILSCLSTLNKESIKGGIVCNNNASLAQLLGVPAKTIIKKNGYKERSLLMAQKIRRLLHTSIGLATSGYEGKEQKELHIGIASKNEQRHKKYVFDTKSTQQHAEYATLGTLYFFLSTKHKEIET
ncbi:MAG: CinA family protein [bacterium]